MDGMIASQLYRKLFSRSSIYDIYWEKIRHAATRGTDGISRKRFDAEISANVLTIERKVRNGTYHFSPFKTVLLSRGATKTPRVVYKPTIRDKTVLRLIYAVLVHVYAVELSRRTLHRQIYRLIPAITNGTFRHILRFDLKDFFPTVDHKILLSKLKRRIRQKLLLDLIMAAVRTPGDTEKANGIRHKLKGVPQGLSVSNILSNVVLFDVDAKYEARRDLMYFRYVDDLLVLCDTADSTKLKRQIQKDFASLNLTLHSDEKSTDSTVVAPFEYLGYRFDNKLVTVREMTVQKLQNSLVRLFSAYKYHGHVSAILEFKLNLRITGCILENHKYGWVFYFSQIDDKALLHRLDRFTRRLCDRFENQPNRVKCFLKTWYEIRKHLRESRYIPNFDTFTIGEKKKILKTVRIKYRSDKDAEFRFAKLIHAEIVDLERDMANLS